MCLSCIHLAQKYRAVETGRHQPPSFGRPSKPSARRSRSNYSRSLQSSRVLNASREGDPTTSPGNHPHSKTCFLTFKWKFLCFNLLSLPCCLSLGTTEKSMTPSSLLPPIRYSDTLIRSPMSFLFFGLTSPCFLNLHLACQALSPIIHIINEVIEYWPPDHLDTPLVTGFQLDFAVTTPSSSARFPSTSLF